VITGEEDPDAAVELFKKAIARSGEDLPGGHNNLGVMLARRGRFEEARREFELAVSKSKGQIPEAEHNLKLCRTLIKAKNNSAALTQFIVKQSKPRS
jgi:Flp pilus assembly protein TadD